MFKVPRWEDWVVIALGVWLVASPWVVGFVDSSNSALANASTIGAILVLLELAETEEHESAKDWIDLVAGLWLIVSPTVLRFASVTPAAVNAITVGLLTVLVAVWEITPFDEKISRWWHDHVTGH
jgi:hypothetical protein